MTSGERSRKNESEFEKRNRQKEKKAEKKLERKGFKC